MELNKEVVKAFAATFIPHFDMYPMQLQNGTYVTIKKRLDMELVSLHLQGAPTLGAYALDQQSQASWLCFDADDESHWQRLLNMAADLTKSAVTAYIEPSRRGGHLWLFTPKLDGSVARRFAKQLLTEHSIQPEAIEIYPKQEKLQDGPGSLMRLPLGIHRKTGRRYHFVTLAGEPLAPTVREQVALLASPTRLSEDFITETLAKIPPPIEPAPFLMLERAGQRSHDTSLPLSERIKQAIPVYAFVQNYVSLDEHGRGCCPFHDDQHQSFNVNQSRNYWHCWAGCGGGSVIDFYMKWQKLHGQDDSFVATVIELAKLFL